MYIPQLDLGVQYQNWRLSIEGALMTKGLIKYIREAPPRQLGAVAEVNKRTQAFGVILSFLSFSERLAMNASSRAGTLTPTRCGSDIKDRHEKVDISRVWALLEATQRSTDTTLSDRTASTTGSPTPSQPTTPIRPAADRSTSTRRA